MMVWNKITVCVRRCVHHRHRCYRRRPKAWRREPVRWNAEEPTGEAYMPVRNCRPICRLS